jgi:hypothetical protein
MRVRYSPAHVLLLATAAKLRTKSFERALHRALDRVAENEHVRIDTRGPDAGRRHAVPVHYLSWPQGALPIVLVTEKQQHTNFLKVRHMPTIGPFFLTPRHGTNHKRTGGAMRESLGRGIPDTEPYTEWLAIVGSIGVAALVCAFLFSQGAL